MAKEKLATQNCRVSVVIPTYNSVTTLERCLESVSGQSRRPCEVIVVDGYSNDNTIHIAEKFKARIILHSGNQASARNAGVTSSTSEFILFLDSDQVLAEEVIRDCVELAMTEGVGMVKIPEIYIGTSFWGSCSAFWKNCHRPDDLEPRFYAKTCMNLVGLLNENLVWGEDREFYGRLKTLGIKEASCRSLIYHLEQSSLREMMIKNIRYGKTIRTFSCETNKKPYILLSKEALMALSKVLKNFSRVPALAVGSLFIFYLKTCTMIVSVLASFSESYSSD